MTRELHPAVQTPIATGGAEPATRPLPYRLGHDVSLVVQDDMARLLDLNQGKFYCLDTVGTRLLTRALDVGPVEAVRCVAHEYQVPEPQVQRDWQNLVCDLRTRRLVEVQTAARRPRLPDRLTVALLLTLAWVCIRVLGWTKTVHLWRRGHGPAPGHSPADEDTRTVRGVDDAVRAIAAKHPLNTQCKERALVCWHLLRGTFHLPAELVIGVMPYPFQAHAWVECGPWTVSDDRNRCDAYTPVARFE